MLDRTVSPEVLAPSTSLVQGPPPPRVITGRLFDGRGPRLSPTERAFLAADLIDGRAVYRWLLLRHALSVTGACLPYVQTVQALSATDRAAVEAEQISLSFARRCLPNVNTINILT